MPAEIEQALAAVRGGDVDAFALVVRARYAEARPVADVAAALGRTVTWVTTTLQRVRRALRDCVEAALREGP